MDYFELYGLPVSFNPDPKVVKHKFYELSKKYHPDFFINDEEEKQDEVLFRHGASPFRTAREPPPKFSWTHVWGTMTWGKRAGAWGQGVDGLKDRKKER